MSRLHRHALRAALLAAAGFAGLAQAQTDPTPRHRSNALGSYEVIHDFKYDDDGRHSGALPLSRLARAGDGTLFGTTLNNGIGRNQTSQFGSVYRVGLDGQVTTAMVFLETTGFGVGASMVAGADGAVYGTTQFGGTYGNGVVFRIGIDGSYAEVHAFRCASAIGCNPADLVAAPDGLYGTTDKVVFKLSSDGSLGVVYPAPAGLDLLGSDGNLYGVRDTIAYRITPGGEYTLLHTFAPGSREGTFAYGLVQANDGAFYGTAQLGGQLGGGTAYRMLGDGSVSVIHDFETVACGAGQCTGNPGGLMQASDGMLYGVTEFTGYDEPTGSIFRMALDGQHAQTLLQFAPQGGDSAYPSAALTELPDGRLVGPAENGGTYGDGTLFVLTPKQVPRGAAISRRSPPGAAPRS